MTAIVDANILKAFYEKTVLDISHSLTGCPEEAFSKLAKIYVDDGGKIEYEWRSLVDPDWFDTWLSREITVGRIELLSVQNHASVCKKVYKNGFPINSKDIWYIRTAKELSISIGGMGLLISEDIDFFDPTKKSHSGQARIKIIKSETAKLKKILQKEENISVMCLYSYLS